MRIRNNEKIFKMSLIIMVICMVITSLLALKRESVRKQYNNILNERYQQVGYVEDRAVILAYSGQNEVDNYDSKIVILAICSILSGGVAYISNPKRKNTQAELINVNNPKEKIKGINLDIDGLKNESSKVMEKISVEGSEMVKKARVDCLEMKEKIKGESNDKLHKINEEVRKIKGKSERGKKKYFVLVSFVCVVAFTGIALKGLNKKDSKFQKQWNQFCEMDIDNGYREEYDFYTDEEKENVVLEKLSDSPLKDNEVNISGDFAVTQVVLDEGLSMEQQAVECYEMMSKTIDSLERMGVNECTYSFRDTNIYEANHAESLVMSFRVDVESFRKRRLIEECTEGMWRENIYDSITESFFREYDKGSEGDELYKSKSYEEEYNKYIRNFVEGA